MVSACVLYAMETRRYRDVLEGHFRDKVVCQKLKGLRMWNGFCNY